MIILIFSSRWLIDVSKDAEGLRVIIDLHGGDEQDELARAEYQEIKDAVMLEVSVIALGSNESV